MRLRVEANGVIRYLLQADLERVVVRTRDVEREHGDPAFDQGAAGRAVIIFQEHAEARRPASHAPSEQDQALGPRQLLERLAELHQGPLRCPPTLGPPPPAML